MALGVAVGVSVDLANASALRAFALSGEALTGRATHQVVGGPDGLPDALAAPLARIATAAPVVEGAVRPARDAARVLTVLGVDPFSEADVRPWLGRPGAEGGIDATAFLTTPGAVAMSEGTAGALGVALGDTLAVRADGRTVVATVVGLLAPDDARSAAALDGLVVADVSTAQEWFGGTGRLTRVDLVLPDDPARREASLARVRAALPPGAGVRAASDQAGTLATMTEAFRLNLTALSRLALVVGLFLSTTRSRSPSCSVGACWALPRARRHARRNVCRRARGGARHRRGGHGARPRRSACCSAPGSCGW